MAVYKVYPGRDLVDVDVTIIMDDESYTTPNNPPGSAGHCNGGTSGKIYYAAGGRILLLTPPADAKERPLRLKQRTDGIGPQGHARLFIGSTTEVQNNRSPRIRLVK